MIEENC